MALDRRPEVPNLPRLSLSDCYPSVCALWNNSGKSQSSILLNRLPNTAHFCKFRLFSSYKAFWRFYPSERVPSYVPAKNMWFCDISRGNIISMIHLGPNQLSQSSIRPFLTIPFHCFLHLAVHFPAFVTIFDFHPPQTSTLRTFGCHAACMLALVKRIFWNRGPNLFLHAINTFWRFVLFFAIYPILIMRR